MDDAEFDIFGEITPRVNEAIGQKVDSAIIFGSNRPAEWQNDIITLANRQEIMYQSGHLLIITS